MKEFNNMYLKIFRFIISIFIVLIFTSCEKKISTNPKEIHWDRDMCSRCAMVISDRNHAVQVINPENGKVYFVRRDTGNEREPYKTDDKSSEAIPQENNLAGF